MKRIVHIYGSTQPNQHQQKSRGYEGMGIISCEIMEHKKRPQQHIFLPSVHCFILHYVLLAGTKLLNPSVPAIVHIRMFT